MGDDALWFKDAIFYELRTRSFYDSDGDGRGDLRGLSEKLDYLQDLGVTAIWILPFYPSPMRDDGYDTADYTTVHSHVGTLDDFKRFLSDAHRRGLKVVTELVLNHTSDQHPWFQRARRAPKGSPLRDFYVWSDDPKKWSDARIIFQDFETSNWTWDPLAQAYFWHRFYSHQPDLNYENPAVHEAMLAVVDHWFGMGVDGLRLDAVPYLYEREGTNCENLPETHAFLKKLRAHVDRTFSSRMLLAEANQWPEDAVAYFGSGDECHMSFHFPIMPRLFMALRMEDSFPIIDILEQTPTIAENCQWAIFLRNHDELTLEMVTDEERDYMVERYASDRQARINLGIRRRLAPLLQNDRRRIELMNALLFSLPGTPVVYYGDEIGMGDNVYLGDRDGVRTPMQWSPDRNAGFSKANPQRLILPTIVDPEYHYESVNVETQQSNPSSLLWWTKRMIALRKQHLAFGRGTFEVLTPANRKVLAFLRRFQEEVLLIVVNLSRFSQYVELDLHEFAGASPLELFGHVAFPQVGELPYLLTLGPHNFYWFSLLGAHGSLGSRVSNPPDIPLEAARVEDLLVRGSGLERVLKDFMPERRWFRSKAKPLKAMHIVDSLELEPGGGGARLLLIEVEFEEGDPELYAMPVRFVAGHDAHDLAITKVRLRGSDAPSSGVLIDASHDPALAQLLLDFVTGEKRLTGSRFGIRGMLDSSAAPAPGELNAHVLGAEQSNTSYAYGDRFVAKLLRKVEEDVSLELELLEQLARADPRPSVATLVGHIELELDNRQRSTLLTVQQFVHNQGDAWALTIDEIERFFERVAASSQELTAPPLPNGVIYRMQQAIPRQVEDLIGSYLHLARLLGRRTGELHLALAQPGERPDFTPDHYTALSRRSFYQSLRNLRARTLEALKVRLVTLDAASAALAHEVLRRERDIRSHFKHVLDRSLSGSRIRVHGDYHLGQVLWTGRDFVIIDFEGEPARSRAERRRRRSPMADVAGMVRSLHYAAYGVLAGQLPGSGQVRPEDLAQLEPWAKVWHAWVSSAFVESYLETVRPGRLLPEDPAALGLLFDVHALEKSLYELGYELNNRPSWVSIPLRGILSVLDDAEQSS